MSGALSSCHKARDIRCETNTGATGTTIQQVHCSDKVRRAISDEQRKS